MKNKRQAAKVLAQTIDERTTEVRDALFDSGVRITPNADKSDLVAGILQNLGTNRRLQKQIGALALEVSPQSFPQIPRKRGRRVAKNVAGFYGQDGQSGQVGQQAIETGGQIAGILLANFLANKQAQKQAHTEAQSHGQKDQSLGSAGDGKITCRTLPWTVLSPSGVNRDQ